MTADVDIAQSDIDEWMENTDDAENQTGDADGEVNNQTDADAGTHPAGNATGQPRLMALHATNDTIDLDITTTDIAPDNPPETVSSPDEDSEGSPSPAPVINSGLLARRQAANPASTSLRTMNGNIDIPDQPNGDVMDVHLGSTATRTPDIEQIISGEGPLTPRNNAGPFVFDGSAGRSDAGQLVVPGISNTTESESRA